MINVTPTRATVCARTAGWSTGNRCCEHRGGCAAGAGAGAERPSCAHHADSTACLCDALNPGPATCHQTQAGHTGDFCNSKTRQNWPPDSLLPCPLLTRGPRSVSSRLGSGYLCPGLLNAGVRGPPWTSCSLLHQLTLLRLSPLACFGLGLPCVVLCLTPC